VAHYSVLSDCFADFAKLDDQVLPRNFVVGELIGYFFHHGLDFFCLVDLEGCASRLCGVFADRCLGYA
jgi:hypothetical protein